MRQGGSLVVKKKKKQRQPRPFELSHDSLLHPFSTVPLHRRAGTLPPRTPARHARNSCHHSRPRSSPPAAECAFFLGPRFFLRASAAPVSPTVFRPFSRCVLFLPAPRHVSGRVLPRSLTGSGERTRAQQDAAGAHAAARPARRQRPAPSRRVKPRRAPRIRPPVAAARSTGSSGGGWAAGQWLEKPRGAEADAARDGRPTLFFSRSASTLSKTNHPPLLFHPATPQKQWTHPPPPTPPPRTPTRRPTTTSPPPPRAARRRAAARASILAASTRPP